MGKDDEGRARRLARNETTFREVNERIQEAANGFGDDGHVYRYLCECARLECEATITLTPSEYEAARATPTTFLLRPGHEIHSIERVVAEGAGFVMVEKVGAAAEEAAAAADD